MFSHSFRWQGFVGFLMLAVLLFISWRLPVTRNVWEQLDQATFFALNGSLADAGSWARFWGIMNVRYIDLIAMCFLFIFLLTPGLLFERHEILRAICGLFVLLLLLMFFRWQVESTAETMGWSGDSPSLRYEPSHRLKYMFIELGTKDSSYRSFPGDHAGVLMFMAMFYCLRKLNKWSVISAAGATFFIMPRLFAGAHSLSDDLVGGTMIMALTIAFGYFTPYLGCGAAIMMKAAVPIADRLFWRRGWLLDWREPASKS